MPSLLLVLLILFNFFLEIEIFLVQGREIESEVLDLGISDVSLHLPFVTHLFCHVLEVIIGRIIFSLECRTTNLCIQFRLPLMGIPIRGLLTAMIRHT